VLVFDRDWEKGLKICQALDEEGGYCPTLIEYRQDKTWQSLEGYDMAVAVMAVGIVVRSLCSRLKSKWTDMPVVAVDSSLSCAVPVVGGHHGANELAVHLHQRLGLYPAITTATDSASRPNLEAAAEKLKCRIENKGSSKKVNLAFLSQDVPILRLKGPKIVIADDDVAVLKPSGGIVVGLGSRRGVSCTEVLDALKSALAEASRRPEEIRAIATAWIKEDETGISEAAKALGIDVIYLDKETLNSQCPVSPSRAADLGLLGVAEPAALALSSKLIMPKKVYGRVTVALGE
jgi:cobalt-precorrin 5A hydrolase